MNRQLCELEDIITQLERIISLFNCMCRSYFENREPNSHDLMIFYSDYTNVIETIRELVVTQKGSLSEITNKLYKIRWELKSLADRNLALLEGGASNV